MNVASVSVSQSIRRGNLQSPQRRLSVETIQQIREANPLEHVIGEHVSLRRSGKILVGRCPWHVSKTGRSFTVNVDKQIWRCWSCNVGGDVFQFVMRFNGVGFFDAVRLLGERSGIQVDRPLTRAVHDRIRDQERLRRTEKEIAEILRLERIRYAYELEYLRLIIRMGNADANTYDQLRRADAKYALVALCGDEQAIRYLASPADQDTIIDQALEDGFVRDERSRAVWEVPGQ